MAYIGKIPAAAALTASDITDGIISNAKLAQDIISADTALGAEPADTDEFLVSDAGTLKRMDYSYIKAAGLTAGTKVSPTAANVTFTGIPSTAKNILISFKGLSHSHGSNSDIGVTIGDSGGLETAGYEATVIYTGTGNDQGGNNYTDKFTIWYSTGASSTLNGIIQLTNLDSNTWCFSSQAADGNNYVGHGAGSKALSGTLTQVSIFSATGGTLDAGDINILYQ
jgi:hypothetical protein